jgi:hypothetical protein
MEESKCKNKKIMWIVTIGWILELAIVIGLLWKHSDLYEFTIAFYLLLAFPFLAFIQWRSTTRGYKENCFGQSVRLKLFFLTGPAVLLCVSLIMSIEFQLQEYKRLGGASKEMGTVMVRKGVPREGIKQWQKDSIEKMKSDQIIYTMLGASMLLLYMNRCSNNSGKNELEVHKSIDT